MPSLASRSAMVRATRSTRWTARAQRCRRTGDGDEAVLHWLAERLQHGAREFEQLVEKQDTVMRQTDLAGPRRRTSADEARRGDGMVRRAKGPARHRAERRVEQTG